MSTQPELLADKITMTELANLFGESMPIEAVTILQKDITIQEARAALNELAVRIHALAPKSSDPASDAFLDVEEGFDAGEWNNTVDCTACGGSGFSGRGTGYDDVCGECGGLKCFPATPAARSGATTDGPGAPAQCTLTPDALADPDEAALAKAYKAAFVPGTEQARVMIRYAIRAYLFELSSRKQAPISLERRPEGSNADEWHLFLTQFVENRASDPNGLTYLAVQIAEAIETATSAAQCAPQPSGEQFEQWFAAEMKNADGNHDHLPDWLKADLKAAWDAASSLPAAGGEASKREAEIVERMPSREEIARIVDPDIGRLPKLNLYKERFEEAYAKADAIRALLVVPDERGGVS